MDFIVSAATDIGIVKQTNQDSFSVRVFNTAIGKVVLAVLCDGMGGLEKGEVASGSLVNAFCKWSETRLPALCQTGITDNIIREEWTKIAVDFNEKIKSYSASFGANMGTTLTALLLTEKRYYIINVGDTRAYEIYDGVKVLTKDQTVVAREIEMGILTPEQAKVDPRRSVLLQCVGASPSVYPDFFFGETKLNSVYMLCSDGFRHEITENEIYSYLGPNVMLDDAGMQKNMQYLIQLDMNREERDNISVLSVRTF